MRDISRSHLGVTITARDVQNIADEKRRQSLHGCTATQQLVHELEHEPGVKFAKEHAPDMDDGRIVSLF